MSERDEADVGAGANADADADERRTPSGETAWQRRRRLDAVFGDVLPETTSDEREPAESPRSSDDWLRAQVPPHHGG